MVFGFLKGGKINLNLNSINFKHGDTITGSATLELSKPKKARGVYVILFAERQTTDSDGDRRSSRIFESKVPLDVEREYPVGTKLYDFKLQIPAENKIEVEGAVGSALKAFKAIGNFMSPIKWYVEIKLDIPGGLDIGKKQQIQVTN